MSLASQLFNKITYGVHALTYDPVAEKFAADQKAKADAAAAAAAKTKSKAEAAAAAAAKKKKDDDAAAVKAAAEKKRETFDIGRAAGRVATIVLQVVLIFLVFLGAIFGSSLATNLNVYQDWPIRVLYAVYGFFFFWIVIPYVLLWRWYHKGLRPRYYALIPLVPYHFDNYYAALLLSWMSYKPDDVIPELKEWKFKSK